MFNPLHRALSNIAVHTKLALGFGMVMLLTVVIAFVGWSGIKEMGERSQRIDDIGKLGTLTRDIRIERLAYIITPDAERAASWLKAVDALDRHLDYARPMFSSALNVPHLDSATNALNDYKIQYAAVVKATEAREATRGVFGNHADEAAKNLERLNAFSNAETGDTAMRDSVARALVLFQRMRFDVRGYTYTLNADAERQAKESMAEVIRFIENLKGSALPADVVQKIDTSLLAYQSTVQQFSDAQVKITDAQANISKDIKILFAAADELTKNQTTLRLEDLAQSRDLLIIGLVIALIVSTLAAWIITRLIVTPLLKTLGVAERVANGDLTHDQISDRQDELGRLENSMQKMTVKLRGLIGGLKDGVVQIASAAEQLSAVTEQTSTGVQSQKVETDQVATAMHEMGATVQEVARNAELASSAAVSASKEAREGDTIVSKAVSQIESLAIEVGHSKTAMDDLKRESDKIGGVLDVIKAVAEQTNLLALNAAIEAARAGEAGRGFAVVADEVRSLAQRTQTSTEEIANLIHGLHTGTDRVATILDNSRSLTESSVELTRKAGVSLNSISRSVSEIESMNQQIAAAAEQQSAVTEEINRSVLNVRDISEQTAAASEETASSSVELARLSVQLQTMVSQFKV
ncbi:methyl-accepting chemotaxis protein [Paucimonas lemoignei]|nr:methyl-accepting chemotaxis protein [Paucimonas lemoignei]